jgi:uncharacterized protein
MPASRILLAPGASGTIERLRPHERGLAARGLSVRLVELPRGTVERALPVWSSALDEEDDPSSAVIGGQSFGGRVASLLAADRPVAAVVLFSYPLHAPGRKEAWDDRTAHWPRIDCPVLLLSGESDPFADIGLLRQAADRLKRPTLVTYPGVGHGLRGALDEAIEEVEGFIGRYT